MRIHEKGILRIGVLVVGVLVLATFATTLIDGDTHACKFICSPFEYSTGNRGAGCGGTGCTCAEAQGLCQADAEALAIEACRKELGGTGGLCLFQAAYNVCQEPSPNNWFANCDYNYKCTLCLN